MKKILIVNEEENHEEILIVNHEENHEENHEKNTITK
jgi:hypothetical protein